MIVYVKLNSKRKAEFQLMTVFEQVNGIMHVCKKIMHPDAEKFLKSFLSKYKILSNYKNLPFIPVEPIFKNDKIYFPFLQGKTLKWKMEMAIRRKSLDMANKIIRMYKNKILDKLPEGEPCNSKEFINIFGESLLSEREWIKPGILDLNFDNFILYRNNVYLIDYEWMWDFSIPKEYILFRAVVNILYDLKSKGLDISSLYSKYKDLLEEEKYLKAEFHFQKMISLDDINYYTYIKEYFGKLTQKYHPYESPLKELKKMKYVNDLLKKLYFQKKFIKNLQKEINENHLILNRKIVRLSLTIMDKIISLRFLKTIMREKLTKMFQILKYKCFSNKKIVRLFLTIMDKIISLKFLKAITRERLTKIFQIFRYEGPFSLMDFLIKYLLARYRGDTLAQRYQTWIHTKENDWYRRELQEFEKFQDNKIKISIIMPVYNTNPSIITKAIQSVKDQVYKNWELCIHDDCSQKKGTKEIINKFARSDSRIKVSFGEKNGHISYATNQALKMATGEYVLFMDHDDMISPLTLFEIVKTIKHKPNVDVIYYDEDVITENDYRKFPIFKPNWSRETLYSIMYLAHSTYRLSLVKKVGGMRIGYEGSQDYDLILRISEFTENIEHIPYILYHWRQVAGSTASNYNAKDYARKAAKKALEDSIKRRKLKAEVTYGLTAATFRIKYEILNNPKVSIIIPTKDHKNDLQKCLASIENKTDYKNYEILIVNNNSKEADSLKYLAKIASKYKVLNYDREFNYAAINNFAVKHAIGEHILLLNNDTEVISSEWLKAMLEFSQQEKIGVVGALLLYFNNTYQHAGCTLGINGIAGHAYRGISEKYTGVLDKAKVIRNVSAVTGACLMVKKRIYKEVGGLDRKLKIAFNDIDFCLKVLKAGYRNIYTPYAKLYHYESKSRGKEDTNEKQKRFSTEIQYMKQKWGKLLENDYYYNPNLTLKYEDESIDT